MFNYTPPKNLIIGGTFDSKDAGMLCASWEAEKRIYRFFKGTSYDWVVGLLPNSDQLDADHVYCTNHNPNSDGFGGRVISFTLENGIELKWKGPWHSNCDALLQETGIDLTKQQYTWGCIGTGRGDAQSCYQTIVTDLLYFDPSPLPGEFSRIQKLAKQLSEERNQLPLYYHSKSYGGSSSGWVNYKKAHF